MVWLLGDARPIFVHTCPHFQSVDKCGHVWLRTTSRTQCWRIGDCTILKSNISAFRKVLRHQNRFSSRRERSKSVVNTCQHLSQLGFQRKIWISRSGESVDKCWHVWLPCASRVQSSGIVDHTVLKSDISAFRKVLRHQNRFSSRRERSKNVKFNGFWTKSTQALQIWSLVHHPVFL